MCIKSTLMFLSDDDVWTIATDSPYNADLYVFLTGSASEDGLSEGWSRGLCDPERGYRTSLTTYWPGSIKGGDAYTAEVNK